MKKNILFSLFAVICMLLTSCTNDDIAITYDTSIKIVTAGAISSFNSYHSGDFDLTGTKKVRTTLLIYNKEGDLVDRQNQYLSNYSQNMTYKASLSAGNYTILAITDIVEYSDLKIDTEFWSLNNLEKLSTASIIDKGYIGFESKILGLAKSQYTVGSSSNLTLSIEPAGALFFVFYKNIHYYSDVTSMGLYYSRNGDNLKFDASGNSSVTITSAGQFNYRCTELDLTDTGNNASNNVYAYSFIVPDSQFACRFSITYKNSSGYYNSNFDPWTMNIQAGEQYQMTLDLSTLSASEERTSSMKLIENYSAKKIVENAGLYKLNELANRIKSNK